MKILYCTHASPFSTSNKMVLIYESLRTPNGNSTQVRVFYNSHFFRSCFPFHGTAYRLSSQLFQVVVHEPTCERKAILVSCEQAMNYHSWRNTFFRRSCIVGRFSVTKLIPITASCFFHNKRHKLRFAILLQH